jgi:hypothetical protein
VHGASLIKPLQLLAMQVGSDPVQPVRRAAGVLHRYCRFSVERLRKDAAISGFTVILARKSSTREPFLRTPRSGA